MCGRFILCSGLVSLVLSLKRTSNAAILIKTVPGLQLD